MASNEHFESQLFNFDNEDIIESKKEVCTLCKVGEIKREGDPTPMTVYTKDGVRIIRHYYKRCNFQAKNAECRASYTLGSLSCNGKRIYEDDALKNKYLITSNQTGFSIDFLVDVVSRIDLSSSTFESMAKHYNRHHQMKLPYDVPYKRIDLNADVLSDAFFLYCYLEICQRYEIKNYQIIQNDVEEAIAKKRDDLMKYFRLKWAGKSIIVIDTGLKPHRRVCKVIFIIYILPSLSNPT